MRRKANAEKSIQLINKKSVNKLQDESKSARDRITTRNGKAERESAPMRKSLRLR